MNKRTVLRVMLTMLLATTLLASFEIRETSASPTVRIYVDMPAQGYITGIPVGEILKVTVNIESPTEWRNTADGIIGWAFNVQVDPDVLEPLTVEGATSEYFLYDFAQTHGHSTVCLFVIEKEAGLFRDIVEGILGYLEVGAGGDGKLCELWFESKSQTAHTSIDLYYAEYRTRSGGYFPVDMVEDGQYNFLELPATIDIYPDTLNLRSEGQWITCYIELPEGYDVSDIDVSTVMLETTIPVYLMDVPAPHPVPTEIGDYDNDTIPDLMVKFNRTLVSELILSNSITDDHATLTITGEVAGTPLRGEDTIGVILGAGGSYRRR